MSDLGDADPREAGDETDAAAEELEIFQTTGRLLAALANGHGGARGELARRFRPAVFGTVRRLGGSYELARALAGTVLDAFLAAEAQGRGPDAPPQLADRLRERLEEALRERAPELLERPRAVLVSLYAQEWRDALVRASLERVVEEVGEPYFEVYRRVVLSNEPVERVGRLLDLTHLAVTTRTQRISRRIRNLREALEDERRPRT